MKNKSGDLIVGNVTIAIMFVFQLIAIFIFISFYVDSSDKIVVYKSNEEKVYQLENEIEQWKTNYYSLAQTKQVVCKSEPDYNWFIFGILFGVILHIIERTRNKKKEEENKKNGTPTKKSNKK